MRRFECCEFGIAPWQPHFITDRRGNARIELEALSARIRFIHAEIGSQTDRGVWPEMLR